MIDYEIEALLKIVDRASPQLEKVLALARQVTGQFEKIQALGKGLFTGTGIRGFTNQMARLDPTLSKIKAQMEAVKAATVGGFGEMDKAIAATAETVRGLKIDMAEAAAAARAIGAAARAGAGFGVIPPGGGSGGRGGGHGGFHASGSVPIPAGHARFGLSPGMIAAGVLGFGVFENMRLQDEIAKMQFVAGSTLTGAKRQAQADQIRARILAVASQTGASPNDLAEGSLKLFQLTAGMPFDQRLSILEPALRFGAYEHQQKENMSIPEGTEAAVSLAHQMGIYDPAGLKRELDKISYLSTITPATMKQLVNARSYTVPLRNLVDQDETTLLLATLQRAGVTSTKGGTWVREDIIRAMSETATISRHASSKQRAAQKALGLIDASGKSRLLGPDGEISFLAESELLQKAAKTHSPAEMAVLERQAFGARGAGFAAMLGDPKFTAQLPELEAEMAKAQPALAYFKTMTEDSPLQQGRVALADFDIALMDLSKDALPAVTATLRTFDDTIKRFLGDMSAKGVSAGDMARGAAIGAGVGYFVAGPPGAAVGGTVGGFLPLASDMHRANQAAIQSRLEAGYIADPNTGTLVPLPGSGGDARSGGASLPERIARAIKEALTGLAVNLDGREVGQVTADAIARAGHAPVTAPGRFDHSASPAPSPH